MGWFSCNLFLNLLLIFEHYLKAIDVLLLMSSFKWELIVTFMTLHCTCFGKYQLRLTLKNIFNMCNHVLPNNKLVICNTQNFYPAITYTNGNERSKYKYHLIRDKLIEKELY